MLSYISLLLAKVLHWGCMTTLLTFPVLKSIQTVLTVPALALFWPQEDWHSSNSVESSICSAEHVPLMSLCFDFRSQSIFFQRHHPPRGSSPRSSPPGMDAPPRGEGEVLRPVPRCGEGGVPRPAPLCKNDQNCGEVAGQNKGLYLVKVSSSFFAYRASNFILENLSTCWWWCWW